MRRFLLLLFILAVVGFVLLQLINSLNPTGVAPVSINLVVTPTTKTINGPVILDAIHNQAKLETVAMTLAEDQTLTRSWGFQGACTEDVTYLGYFNVTAGVDLQAITPADISVTNEPGAAQPTITIQMPPADIQHVELDTQRSRVIHDDVSLISQICGSQVAEMVTEAQGNLQKMAEASALTGGILNMAQERASFELQRLLLELGYTNVKFINPTPGEQG